MDARAAVRVMPAERDRTPGRTSDFDPSGRGPADPFLQPLRLPTFP